MKKRNLILSGCLAITCIFASCGNKELVKKDNNKDIVEQNIEQKEVEVTNSNYTKYADENDIKFDVKTVGKEAEKYYTKYIDYTAPNGKPIHILAQDKIKNEQLLYVHSILSFYLDTLENNGHTGVANSMANNNALLVMPNGSDGDGSSPEEAIIGQPQYQNETANVGSKWYIENDYSHRDSTFEEVFHLVHNMGIGTIGNKQADPKLATTIKEGMTNALPKEKADWGKKGLWGLNAKESLMEWNQETGALEAEYIICAIDTYYGMWNAFDGNGALYGEYIAKTREGLAEKDPTGYAIVKSILPEHITSMMRVDPSFEGDFKMSFDKKDLYTYKSQYLKNIRLTGNNNSNIIGNDEDNIFIGNSGDNVIDGKDGQDIVQFLGTSEEYQIDNNRNYVTVTDSVKERDGKDQLHNISILRFIDKDIVLNEL